MKKKKIILKKGDFFHFPFGTLNGKIIYGYGKIIDIDECEGVPFIGFYGATSLEKLDYTEIIKRPVIFQNWCGMTLLQTGEWEIVGTFSVCLKYERPYFIGTVSTEIFTEEGELLKDYPNQISEIPKIITIEAIVDFYGNFSDMVDEESNHRLTSENAYLLNFSYKKMAYGAIAARENFRRRMSVVFEREYLRLSD